MLLHHGELGSGPVVVLLHGFPLDQTMWQGQRDSIGRFHRLITPDLRGHGLSVAPEGTYSIDTLADDVIETLDRLRLAEPVVVGGLSMGGYVALSMAARYPGRLRGLMLMDTRASADTPDAARTREEMARGIEKTGDITPVVEGMLPRLFAPATRGRRPDLIAAISDQMLRTSPLGVIGALRGLACRPDRTPDLPRISVPTLVLGGSDDVISPPDEMRRLAKAIPGSRFVEIADAGHLAPLENPPRVNEAILEFLDGLG